MAGYREYLKRVALPHCRLRLTAGEMEWVLAVHDGFKIFV